MANRLKSPRYFTGLIALLIAGCAALSLAHGWFRAPYITNDGYQYLDAAASIASGGCFCVHMAHFDEQVKAGQLPVRLTHYPPAYPLLIAGLARLGWKLEIAGYAISAAGYLLAIWLIWDTGFLLGASPLVLFVFAAVWVGHSGALMFASSILTESIFAAAVTSLGALIVRDVAADGERRALLPWIGGLAGTAYALRYAGIFLIPPVMLYLGWRWRRTPAARMWALTGMMAGLAIMLPIQIRNIVVMGSWRGMYLSHAPLDLTAAMLQGSQALWRLVLGNYVALPLPALAGLFAITVAIAFMLILKIRRQRSLSRPLAWIGLIALVYGTGVTIATARIVNMGVTTQELVRYFLPLYPIFLAAMAAIVSSAGSRILRSAGCALAIFVLAVQSLSFTLRPGPGESVVMAGGLGKEVYAGMSVRSWLLDRVPPDGAIVSEEGQALHYVLQRPVVSIIEPPEGSDLPNNEAAFRSLLSRYGSRYLVLFPRIRDARNSLPFLRGLRSGHIPGWLELRLRTDDVAVYECETCETRAVMSARSQHAVLRP